MSRLRALMPAAAAVLALCAGGCHNKQDAYTEASSEGVYLKAGGLKYQIQISRGMNPGLREDATLMRGLPKGTKATAGANEWFGVWMRVENDGSHGPKPVARTFEISDSLGQVYKPIPLDPRLNALAYQPNQVVGTGLSKLYPNPNSVPGQLGTRGMFILWKLPLSVYQNRPASLKIVPRTGKEATVELDL